MTAKLTGLGVPKENSCKWALRYMDAVINEKIPVCHWVKMSVARHIEDLKTAGKRGFYFDEGAAQDILDFFSFLHLSKGSWGGNQFILAPWQQFFLYVLFGWLEKKDKRRRFRIGYLEVGKKNGKTTLAAGVGLYMLDSDEENGAEVYSFATKRDQAKIVHEEAKNMLRQSRALSRTIKFGKGLDSNIYVPETGSKFAPLSSDHDSNEGINTSCGIGDEIHVYKDRGNWDVVETSMVTRRQPLLLGITTAGVNQQGVCRQIHNHLEQILDRVIIDDRMFGMIFTLDEGDDWRDEVNWVKPNPNLGVNIEADALRPKALRAQQMPSAVNAFLREHMNVWTNAESAWMTIESWRASAGIVDAKALNGHECYMGMDLSTTTDISAISMVFPMGDGTYQALFEFWIPAACMEARVTRDRVPYDVWVREGYVHATDGNSIDYDFIEHRILELAKIYKIKEIAFDPYNATEITNHLIEQGLEMVSFQQGFLSLSPPTKKVEILVADGKLHHGNNPVMNWMITNVIIREDPAGNKKPDKAKSREKIDGVVALIMAVGRAIGGEGKGPSVYESRGVRAL